MSSKPKSNEDWASEIQRLERVLQDETTNSADPSRAGDISPATVSKLIDHTLLKLDATPEQIDKLCNEAKQYDFKTVCVRVNYVKQAVERLKGTGVGVACVIGFHEGTQSSDDKVREAQAAIQAGATDLDTVLNRTDLFDRNYTAIFHELSALRSISFVSPTTVDHSKPTLKLILETSQLEKQSDVIAACHIAAAAGCDFVKTSTGFCGRGASVEDVLLMKKMCDVEERLGTTEGRKMQVKASGGIRTYEDAKRMVGAGAGRLGVSAGVEIVKGAKDVAEGGEGSIHGRSGPSGGY